MATGTVTVRAFFVTCLRDFHRDKLPENGMVVTPRNGSGNWNVVCATTALAKTLKERIGARDLPDFGGFPTCWFNAGSDWTPEQLKNALAACKIEITFVNKPTWPQ